MKYCLLSVALVTLCAFLNLENASAQPSRSEQPAISVETLLLYQALLDDGGTSDCLRACTQAANACTNACDQQGICAPGCKDACAIALAACEKACRGNA